MRCYAEPSRWTADAITLDADESHHLVRVMRAQSGQAVVAFDGRGREAEAEIKHIERDRVTLRILKQVQHLSPTLKLILVQALPREQKMDLILQKATELGVSEIHPVISDNAVVRLKVGQDAAKRERWGKIVLSAAKQCGAHWLPILHPIQKLVDLLKNPPSCDVLLVCSLESDAVPLRNAMAGAKAKTSRRIGVLVGPEGDFSEREMTAAREAGARPVSLGPLTLRAETAALYVLSVLQYEYNG